MKTSTRIKNKAAVFLSFLLLLLVFAGPVSASDYSNYSFIQSVSAVRRPGVGADAGFFSGNDDYDFSGGNNDSGWSYDDRDSFDSYDSYDDNSNYSSSDRRVRSDRSSDSFPYAGIVVMAIVLLAIFWKHKKESGPRSIIQNAADRTRVLNEADFADLIRKDPAFDIGKLESYISNLYVRLQNHWQKQDFEPMRSFMTDRLFNQMKGQLENQISANQQSRIQNIAVMSVSPISYVPGGEYDKIVFRLMCRINVCVIDKTSGNVVSGDPAKERFMTYEWDMIRSAEMKTLSADESKGASTCPNCGAPVDLAYSSVCAYCNSVISAQEYDWTIAEIRGISQKTA